MRILRKGYAPFTFFQSSVSVDYHKPSGPGLKMERSDSDLARLSVQGLYNRWTSLLLDCCAFPTPPSPLRNLKKCHGIPHVFSDLQLWSEATTASVPECTLSPQISLCIRSVYLHAVLVQSSSRVFNYHFVQFNAHDSFRALPLHLVIHAVIVSFQHAATFNCSCQPASVSFPTVACPI